MWLNAVLFQLGWFVCVLERGVLAVAAAALIVGIHLYRQRNQRWEWTAIAIISLIGIAQDQAELDRVLAHARTIDYVKKIVNHVRVKTRPS